MTRAQSARAYREALGLTLPAMARYSGFSRSQIIDYEQGARRGKKDQAVIISESAWLRYGLACAAIKAGKKPAF